MNFIAAEVPPPGAGLATVTSAVPALAKSAAGTAAVSLAAPAYVVASATPFQLTFDAATNPVPVTVSVNAAPPSLPVVGEIVFKTGAGLSIVNVFATATPPPGAGLSTVTATVPALARSVAGIAAVSAVVLTNVVASAVPFHTIFDVDTKFVPVTVSVKAAPGATTLVFESAVSVGAGLSIVNVLARVTPPAGAGLSTVTATVPALARSVAGIAAESDVPLINFVASATPFHTIFDVVTNFVPVTVSVNAAPGATTLVFESAVSVGGGLSIVNVLASVTPPAGAGFSTVTATVPALPRSAAGIAAVSAVVLTNVVASAVPFQTIFDVVTNFVPVTVSVNAAPGATTLVFESAVSVGSGLSTVTVAGLESFPPAPFIT